MQAPHILHDWRKDTILPVGRGYSVRPSGVAPSSIVIHTTSSAIKNTQFASEATYLQKSQNVSAHYLCGKQGQIAQILHPDLMAWHAGVAQAAWLNAHSIGIESHVSQGETWTEPQHTALTWLVRWLMALYGIPAEMIETHRKVALPAKRKSDPTGWEDEDFYRWRAGLAPVSPPQTPELTKRYRVRRVLISTTPEGGLPYAGELAPGEEVVIDKWYASSHTGHLQGGRGFVRLDDLEAI